MSRRALVILAALALPSAYFVPACGGNGGNATGSGASGTAGSSSSGPAPDPGALLDVSMTSQVGVVLEEIPMSERDRVAQAVAAKPTDFWTSRVVNQAKLTTYRLVFRQLYYPFDKRGTRPATRSPSRSRRPGTSS